MIGSHSGVAGTTFEGAVVSSCWLIVAYNPSQFALLLRSDACMMVHQEPYFEFGLAQAHELVVLVGASIVLLPTKLTFI